MQSGDIPENQTIQRNYSQLKKQLDSLAKYLSVTLTQGV